MKQIKGSVQWRGVRVGLAVVLSLAYCPAAVLAADDDLLTLTTVI